MLRVKICGMRDPANIQEVGAIHPDFMGFIFYPGSPRCALGTDPEVLKGLPPLIRKIGVFVNESFESIQKTAARYQITTLQLHGQEGPELCDQLEQEGFTVIKAFGIADKKDLKKIKNYEKVCSYVLLDTKTGDKKVYGGSGISFDRNLLRDYDTELPFFLAGGISPDSLEEISAIRHPYFFALDLNSRFESAPGIKDAALIKQFTEKIILSL